MAIGLNDLGKKKRAPSTAKTKSEALKSTTVRPWSDSSSLKSGRAPQQDFAGASFDDSFDSDRGPLLWLDHAQTTKFARLQRKLAQAEQRLQENINAPLTALRRFLNRSH